MATKLKRIIANFETSLASNIAQGGTNGTLTSNVDKYGTTLPDGSFYFSVNIGKSNFEHITATKTGLALTNIKTVNLQTGAETTGTLFPHDAGESIAVTDYAVIKDMLDLLNGTTDFDAATPLAYDGAVTHTANLDEFATVRDINTTVGDYLKRDGTNAMTADLNVGNNKVINMDDPTNPLDGVNKQTLDAAIVSGGVPANTTTPGIVRVATDIEFASGTNTSGGYYLMPTISQAQGTLYTATALEDLTAGQTVGVALASGDNKVVRSARNKTTLSNNPSTYAYIEAVEYVAANKFIAVGGDGGGGNTEGTVFTVDRNTMSLTSGAKYTFPITIPGEDRNNLVRLADNRLLGAWRNTSPSSNVILYDISGTTISQTTVSTNLLIGTGAYFGQAMCNIDTNVVAIAKGYGTGSDKCDIVTVSGNTITLTTTTNLPFNVTTSGGLLTSPMVKIGTGKFVITNGSTSIYVGSYSGGTLTFGSAFVTTGQIRNIVSTSTDTFYTTDASGNVGYFTVSGTTITAVDQASNITDTDLNTITTDGTNVYRLKSGTGDNTGKLTKVTLNGGTTLSEEYITYSDMFTPGQLLGVDVANGYFVGYYNADAYISGMTPHYVGIAQSTVVAGDTVSVKVGGVDGNQTGLVPGAFYKPSNGGLTPANIDQDSNQTLDILKAVSSTEIVL